MSAYSKFARIAIPAFTVAVLAAVFIQQPARAGSSSTQAHAPLRTAAQAVNLSGAFDDILMGYVNVLVRNGQAGSLAQARLAKLTASRRAPCSERLRNNDRKQSSRVAQVVAACSR